MQTSPPTWPRAAKVAVVVLLVATVVGVVGTIAALVLRDDRSAEVEQLESEVATLTSERDDALAGVDRLETDVATLEAELADEAQRVEAAEANAAASAKDVTELEATVAELEATVTDLRARVDAVTAERDRARATIGELEADLMQGVVSGGEGIQVAVPYPSDASVHPIAVLGDGAQAPVTQQVPTSWNAPSVFDLELVAHVGDSEQAVIEECPYNGPNITRYRYSTTIAVYAATTGEQIAEATLTGADPRECRQMEPWSLTELHGDEVGADQIIGWLEQYVVANG